MSINNQEREFYREMGFRLKKIRQEKNVSQESLARSLGMVKQTIQKYESGEIKLQPDVLLRCATIFKISVGYFYGEEKIKIPNNSATILLASEISKLPSNDIKKNLFQLVRSINHVTK